MIKRCCRSVSFFVDKAPRGGVYFKRKTKEGKSVERQGRKATGPEAQLSMAASYNMFTMGRLGLPF